MDSPSAPSGSTRRWTGRVVGVLILAIVVTVAGCSGSDGSSSDPGPAADTSTPVTTGAEDATPSGPLARYADFRSETYEDPASWLCRPDTVDVCDSNQDATVVEADGTLRIEEWSADPDAPIDCFYVYPTISRDPSEYSDMDASPEEEGAAALNQVARLGSVCRVFAPIYRQRTLAGLAGAMSGGGTVSTTTVAPGSLDFDDPFSDVVEAWKSYMARDNQGRGVVLIGHSQGAGLLKRLLQTEFDPDDHGDVREVLVGAYLAGASVMVPDRPTPTGSSTDGTGSTDGTPGGDNAGDLANVPLCTATTQTGCVVTWSTYRAGSPPPPDAIFGRPDPDRPGLSAACVNPAAPSQPTTARGAAGAEPPVEAHGYFPARRDASIITGSRVGDDVESDDGSGNAWVAGSTEAITTPFVTAPGLLAIRCVEHDGYVYLELTNHDDPGPRVDDIGGDLTPQWGMHLQDVNIVMGDVITMVREQTASFVDG